MIEVTSTRTLALGELFEKSFAAHASRCFLRVDDRSLTYADVGRLVDGAAARLADRGVTSHSRVALSAGNSVEFVVVVLAVLRLRATLVMVSTSWREREVEHAITLTEPTHLVHDGSGASDLAGLGSRCLVIRVDEVVAGSLADVGDFPGSTQAADADAVALMVFSSGTTGLPKAVLHTHRSMGHAIAHWTSALGLTADDRLQIATPPFHILGLLNLLAVARAGASVRLHQRFDLDAVLAAVEGDRVTIEMAVAPIAMAIAAHPDLERFDLSSLRYIMWGATPVSRAVADRVTARSGVRFLAAYGASELPVISANPVSRPDEWRLDSVGRAPVGVEVRVVGLATSDVLAPGEAGELQVRSPSAMAGYLPASADHDAFADGWYRTGDVGEVDVDGWVTITDRVKEMIKVNGFQVAPAEIEGVLLGDPSVRDCAVFGVPDPRTGEAVAAAVVATPGVVVDADRLRALVADNLASYKRIDDIRVVDEIPRLPSGKVLRRQLAAGW